MLSKTEKKYIEAWKNNTHRERGQMFSQVHSRVLVYRIQKKKKRMEEDLKLINDSNVLDRTIPAWQLKDRKPKHLGPAGGPKGRPTSLEALGGLDE